MPWNNGGPDGGSGGRGPSPWGSPDGEGPRNPGRPNGRPGGPNGPWGGGRGPGGGTPPDFDEIISRVQGFLRGLLPPSFGGGGGGPRGRGSFSGGRGLAIIVAILLVVWLASGFYRVQPDEQGVVLRFGAYDRTTLPGLNYHIPWPVEAVLRPAVTRINRVEVGYRTSSDIRAQPGRDISTRDVPEESLMLTGDENIIDIDFAVFWRIRDASAYLFNTRNPGYTVKSAAESVMREVIGRTPDPAGADRRARADRGRGHAGRAGDSRPVRRGRGDHAGAVAEGRSAECRDRQLPRRAARQHGRRADAQRGGELSQRHRPPRPRRRRAADRRGGRRATGVGR